jgi:hypothetical protein
MKPFYRSPQEKRHGEIVSRLDRIIALLTDLKKNSPVSEAVAAAAMEHYTNDDLRAILRVSKRTLARYRQKKLIAYYTIRGKIYYKVAEIREFLQKKGKGSLEP